MSTAHPTVARSDFWTADRVADALAPLADVNLPRGQFVFGRVSTDIRTIEQGDLFVALAGERFDAHDFLADAVAKGAAGLVVSSVSRAAGLGVPIYQVRDTLVALGALGTYRRRAWNKPAIAVVGSNGKTSAKELIKAAPRPIEMRPLSQFKSMYYQAVKIDWDKAERTDPTIPLIVATEEGKPVLIDGWHRYAKALRARATEVPAVILTEEETQKIRR